jgi:hypothetical protein
MEHNMGRACSIHGSGERRNTYKVQIEKPEGNRPLRKPRYRWMDNIKVVLK